MINDILNGDSASDIREKLNELINIVNDYSSSQYMDAGDGGAGDYTPPAGDGDDSNPPAGGGDDGMGDGGYTPPASADVQLWDNNASPMGESSALSACGAINMGTSHDFWISKDPMNMGGTSVPEVGDTLYTDSALAMQAPESMYFGWEDTTNMQNKSIEIGNSGLIQTISNC